ncbi:hypothetical protein [Prosthecobacter sp.]|uniref:hypothetical protein n=1 Tax=Prosthecobacter sp. TaxID=1965333 RepID=UPI003783DBE2
MNRELLQDTLTFLIIALSIVTGLFLLSLVRMVRLSRSNKRMRTENAKMEKQAALQQMEVISVHHDAMSWRARIQRQFDALRSDLSHRLQQADQGGANALKELDAVHQQTLAVALARISELEAALAAKPRPAAPAVPAAVSAVAPKPPPPPPSSLPALPAMETLRIQSLESELNAARAELTNVKQQNAGLQRALLLARRRGSMTPMRKSAARHAARSA